MSIRREEPVRQRLEQRLEELASTKAVAVAAPSGLHATEALAVVEAAFKSRLLDFESREMKNRGTSFYTIGSAGHEMNAVLGQLLRPTDPALLHYRSGAFMAARSQKEAGSTFLWDTLLSFSASSDDPVSAGRHKVWGSREHWVIPQTSTIASQLPKAVGLAFSLSRARHLGLLGTLPEDSVVLCSFGDASLNHASASTAFNAARWAAHQNLPMPILFLCEDNGLGISVHTPKGWVEASFRGRRNIEYFHADGTDLQDSFLTARAAIDHCRKHRKPCFLHMDVVRLLGHAGSDIETLYHEESKIAETEARDPLLAMCRDVVELGLVSGEDLRALYHDLAARIERVARRAETRPKLESKEAVMAPLSFPTWKEIEDEAQRKPKEPRTHSGANKPRHMALLLSWAIDDLMSLYPEVLVFGEDVAKKGGVYHVTAELSKNHGVGRVFNTLLDETSILGLASGAAHIGFLPMPEIQYLAYLHNAEDQLRGEACSQRFFSNGQWDNPMVVRIASLAYQKGFGGHFHNDNSIAVLRDIPGLVIGLPSRGDDAVRMLRTMLAAAKKGRAVCAFLEPIALLMTKDLHEAGDALWSFPYPEPGEAMIFGEARRYDAERGAADSPRLLIVSYGNGIPMSLRVRRKLPESVGRVRILDLRWLAPLPMDCFRSELREADAVLIVDECRRTGGGVAEPLLATIAEDPELRGKIASRVTAEDSYVPLGAAANLVLPQEEDIRSALEELSSRVLSGRVKEQR